MEEGGAVMKKLGKTKKGFTLVEMVLVIAILVILALVVFFSVSHYLNAAKTATEKMDSHYADIEGVTAQLPGVFQ